MDWEFKLQRFVRPFALMEEWMESVKDRDREVMSLEAQERAE